MRTTCGQRILVAKTCLGCGELKMAKHFSTIVCKSGAYRNSQCHSCNNKKGKPIIQNHQQRSKRTAVKHAQPWTEGDFSLLEELTAEGLTVAQIAIRLNRSVYAIYTIRNNLKEATT